MSDSDIDRHVRHLVGIAALRRLRRMVDGEVAAETAASIRARRLTILLAVGAVILVAGLALMLIRTY